ncbi:multidrug resistance protein MdtA precursor [mine drainage metagenome]|uniref:Multidrug resistance protein MdtA n=1 Tax=mine drainage metagenome TaxID=410659 RepID=A0A1J5RUA0_9ZZZZ
MNKRLRLSLYFGVPALLIIAWVIHVRRAAAEDGANRPGWQRGGEAAPVNVIAGVVKAQDTPIYLDGIGTVAAYNTVTVKPRVDGQLVNVRFREGQDVKAGDLLALIDDRSYKAQLDQAIAKRAQDAAQLDNARTDLQRNADLFKRGLIDQQTFATQRALVEQLTAAVQADAASIENAQVQLDYTRITAPIDGRTGIRQVDQGNIVHASDANGIVVITQLKPISVLFTLPQQNLPELLAASHGGIGLTVDAFDRDNRVTLGHGTVSVIDNQIDPNTGTVKLKATFPNENLALWPGQFVNVRLIVSIRKNGLVVPTSVVQRGPQGAYAFVIKPDSTVEMRPVVVGQIDAGNALIDKGLTAGERVVVDGQYKLREGSRVTTSNGSDPANSASGESSEVRRHRHAQ